MPVSDPVLILTRPADDSLRLATRVEEELGFSGSVVVSPLVEIIPVEVGERLPDHAGLVFTSRHAVARAVALGAKTGTPCWCVGQATAQVAREAGFTAHVGGGTADALVKEIATARPQAPLLHLRGETSRGDVAASLTRAGIYTRECIVYRQVLQPLSAVAERALSGGNPVIVPVFSPASARQFASQAHGRAPLFVAAISPAAADALGDLEMKRLIVADAPTADAVFSSVKTLIAAAGRFRAGEAGSDTLC